MQRLHRYKYLILALLLVSGSSVVYLNRHVPQQVFLHQSQRRWEQQHLQAYRYTLTPSCLCGYDIVTIEVHHNTATFITRVSDGGIEPVEFYTPVASINNLFMLIEQNIGKAQVRVTYNASYGYPQTIFIMTNPYSEHGRASYQIDNFEVIK